MVSPWYEFRQQVEAFFGGDPDVEVGVVEAIGAAEYKLTIRVHGSDKAESIAEILPTSKAFGNVVVKVEVVPDNDAGLTVADHIRRAFAGNPLFAGVIEVPVTPTTFGGTYVLFVPEVVQYYSDNLQSPFGMTTLTVEELASKLIAPLSSSMVITSDKL